jgi:tryptophan synthase alpha chain
MNRIDELFRKKSGNILSVYFTAGYPKLNSTADILAILEDSGVDMVEIGIPFSDPMADGPVIQKSNEQALMNGMNLKLLFSQLTGIRKKVSMPLLLMGYLNPVVQFGVEEFCRECQRTAIDGVILPDLPPLIYTEEYQEIFERFGIYNILLITPQSSPERVLYINSISKGFVYMVSSSAVTGVKAGFSEDQVKYFSRIRGMNLSNPCLTGFGISNAETFHEAGLYSAGGIIGSAFVKVLGTEGDQGNNIRNFIKSFKNI